MNNILVAGGTDGLRFEIVANHTSEVLKFYFYFLKPARTD